MADGSASTPRAAARPGRPPPRSRGDDRRRAGPRRGPDRDRGGRRDPRRPHPGQAPRRRGSRPMPSIAPSRAGGGERGGGWPPSAMAGSPWRGPGAVDSAVAALLERERGRRRRRDHGQALGPIAKSTGPRPAAHPRPCSAPVPSPTRSRRTSTSPWIYEEELRRRVVGSSSRGERSRERLPERLRGLLQRRGAARGDGRPRRAPRRRTADHRPLCADRRATRTARCSPPPRTAPRTRATCSRSCRRRCSPRLGFPLTELTKPEVREIAARNGLFDRPQAGEPGSLLPRRPGKGAGSCAATATCGTATAASLDRSGRVIGRHAATTTSPSASAGNRRLGPRAALRAREGRRHEHGHRRNPREPRSEERDHPRRRASSRRAQVDSVSLRYRSAAVPARHRRRPLEPTPSSRSSSGSHSTPWPPARRPCS